MAYLSHRDFRPSIASSLNLFSAENVDLTVNPDYYDQCYPKQPPENIHFQIYSNEDYFADMSSTFKDLHVVFKKYDSETPSLTDKIFYENCVLLRLT